MVHIILSAVLIWLFAGYRVMFRTVVRILHTILLTCVSPWYDRPVVVDWELNTRTKKVKRARIDCSISVAFTLKQLSQHGKGEALGGPSGRRYKGMGIKHRRQSYCVWHASWFSRCNNRKYFCFVLFHCYYLKDVLRLCWAWRSACQLCCNKAKNVIDDKVIYIYCLFFLCTSVFQ